MNLNAADADRSFTLLMVDTDALSWQNPTLSPLLHGAWTGVSGSALDSAQGLALDSTEALIEYMGPAGLGPGSYAQAHRYVFLLFPTDPESPPPAFPASFDRTSWNVTQWLAAYNLTSGGSSLPYGAFGFDLVRSAARLPNSTTCDGNLRVSFATSAGAARSGDGSGCDGVIDMAESRARPAVVFFQYPYFTDELFYSVVALERPGGQPKGSDERSESARCLWAVANIRGDVLNNPSTPIDTGDDAATLAAYSPPTQEGVALKFLLFVQPGLLVGAGEIPASQRGSFDVDEWAAGYGISFPSASSAFVVVA